MTTVESGKAFVFERKIANTATARRIGSGLSCRQMCYRTWLPSTPEDLRVFRSAHSQKRYDRCEEK